MKREEGRRGKLSKKHVYNTVRYDMIITAKYPTRTLTILKSLFLSLSLSLFE